MAIPSACASPVVEDRGTAVYAAFRLVEAQRADGAWPAVISPAGAGPDEGATGAAGLALARAYPLVPSSIVLDAASIAVYRLLALRASDPAPALGAASVRFLLEDALLTRNLTRADLGRAAYLEALGPHPDASAFAGEIVNAAAADGDVARGFAEAGSWSEAALASGFPAHAEAIATVLDARATTLVTSAPGYARALAGVLTADVAAGPSHAAAAELTAARLAAIERTDGSFAGGVAETSAAALALYAFGDVVHARSASSWVRAQATDQGRGGWRVSGQELVHVDSLAIQALVAAVLPPDPPAVERAAGGLAAARALVRAVPLIREQCAGYPVTPATPQGLGPCPEQGTIAFAWACFGYAGNVDHFGAVANVPQPGAQTPHVVHVAQILLEIEYAVEVGVLDPSLLYVGVGTSAGDLGGECSQSAPA